MPAKKNTPKAAAKKAATKPAKASGAKAKNAAAPKKAAAPASGKAAAGKAAKAPKAAPKKSSVTPKAAAPAKKPARVVTPEPAQEEAKKAPVSQKKAPAPAVKRSSVVDFPAPPAPVKPPFVPPKAVPVEVPAASSGANGGSHSAAFIQKQRQRLLDLRDELVDAMSGMTRDTIRNAPEGSEASGSGMHQGDAGSDAYDRDFALSVLAKEQDALYEIEQALRRIQSGVYGICEISSRKIPQTRLEVIPFARLTVEEQARWEKEYGNRRFRPSNEVGFSGGKTSDDEDSDTVSLDEEDD